jgi:3-hydroxymyristoyl/3-hydroxydecanoyl-(acyl carrier protein) dehydratase
VKPPAPLPHGYPFRFVDTVLEERNADFSRGRARVNVTSNAWAAMGEQWRGPTLLAEAVAQAALLLEGGDPVAGGRGFLAGLDGFEVKRVPRAGETLCVDVRIAARFGQVIRFEGEVTSAGEEIARGGILVRRGEAAPAAGP